MTQYGYIFCHGFGFDTHFWDPLLGYFAKDTPTHCLDLGYFNKEIPLKSIQLNPNINYVAIGHSFGFQHLSSSCPIPFLYYIGIQGFINFLGFDKDLHERRYKEWVTLNDHFSKSPEKTLKGFYTRCGTPSYDLSHFKETRLKEDLKELRMPAKAPSVPTLIIGANDDVIVPKELLIDNFSSQPQTKLTFLNEGKHSLGYNHASEIYQLIMEFIRSHD